ncbi:MAG: ferritin-like domain-containing protein [Candidatus Eremiobacteraeota bacterium]|nr:ferritin-like domain-containing protein [Candidatus Eremiobacteraeota bacterium]MBC5828241.1 ferritin-like domain-containing protein [Candidatus Eremiobacteraeota bacterium]
MKLASLEDLYVDELKDLYNAEKQLLKALPKMAKASSSGELRTAFREHLEQTKEHVTRLEQIFEQMGSSGRGKKCKGMEGLIEEGQEMMAEDAEPAVKDAALISAAQRVEHYEMAGYGCVRAYAETLGFDDAVELLQQTLDEENQANEKLTEIAETVNEEAAEEETAAAR